MIGAYNDQFVYLFMSIAIFLYLLNYGYLKQIISVDLCSVSCMIYFRITMA